ncbi:hypothetical protein [Methanosphaera sp. BMS]|uniref:hypothetical protein n=1 Tax=Methanosphaera sp. BMS TaxID=1789762 RepID=UPI000DC1DA9D|nr:hypothetical protein [Methanosphaera sp. BMS]AWX33568.1 hypothetical protein AW729_10925 [Methanosphaera sp. BMS]MBR3214550.1 hypothetical protein [Methanosphaera sp.]
MDDKQKLKIIRILWLITDIVILIAAIYLLVLGETSDKIIGVIGLLLLVVEAILYKQKRILQ